MDGLVVITIMDKILATNVHVTYNVYIFEDSIAL